MDFRTRKQARIQARAANSGKQPNYKFRVVCNHYSLPDDINPVLPGLFASRKDAERYAFEQRGPLVGNTSAWQDMMARIGNRGHFSNHATFAIERVVMELQA